MLIMFFDVSGEIQYFEVKNIGFIILCSCKSAVLCAMWSCQINFND